MFTGNIVHNSVKDSKQSLTCKCYPEHCCDGALCWCDPEVYIINNNRIIVHRWVNADKEKLN